MFVSGGRKRCSSTAIMVHHQEEDTYSFRLNHTDTNLSSEALTTLHKQRIDTLFRSKRLANQNRQTRLGSPESTTTISRNSTHSFSSGNSTIRSQSTTSLKHSSSVLINSTSNNNKSRLNNTSGPIKSPGLNTASTNVSVHPAPTTIIQINSGSRPLPPDPRISTTKNNHVLAAESASTSTPVRRTESKKVVQHTSQAQVELEQAFGGKDQRQKAFMDTRSAVQAQIERLFADATRENTTKNQRIGLDFTCIPSPPPLPSRAPEPPPPPSLKTHPAFRNASPSLSSPSSFKRNTPSPHSSGSGSACSTVSRSSSHHSSHSLNSNMVYRVDYLGAIQLTGKATSLDVLQDPLKQLYYIYKFNISKGSRAPLSTLSITDSGLRVLRNASSKEEIDFTNPFSTIAVWAAIKMVIKKKINNNGQVNYSYAFLPLICDPEAQEKFNTYYPLNVADPTIMDGPHPPMFACVMRKIGESRILECHGFICRSSEDAIVIAANLYQALLGTMNPETNTSLNEEPDYVMSDSELTPTRPPRRRRTPSPSVQGSLRRACSEDMLRTTNTLDGYTNRLHRTNDKISLSILEEIGLTQSNKLPIPRSKSFANMSESITANNIFGEPKKKIILGSIDDVLKAVINPNGMSFTEMDPQHRELLMKMALMLTKDEIYKRSKNIMRSQRPRSISLGGFESDSDTSTITSVIKATKRSISRFGSRASNSLRPSYFKERMPLKKFNTHQGSINIQREQIQLKETSLKTIEYKQVTEGSLKRRAPKTPMPKRNHSGYSSYSECEYDSECSSKCYCTLPTPNSNIKHNCAKNKSLHAINAKKGGCDCESESCAESERCYCSLKNINKNGLKTYEINLDTETDTTVTSGTMKKVNPKLATRYGSLSNISDSESRNNANSWKSAIKSDLNSHLNQHNNSRSNGTIMTSKTEITRQMSMISTGNRPNVCRSSTQRTQYNRPRHRARSTDSVLEIPSRRYMNSSGSLGSHGSANSESSSRSSPGLDSQNSDGSADSSSSQPKILLLSAVDPQGKVVYRGHSQKKRRENSDTESILSMKKTAEIAALFSELKLNQKTDLIEQLQKQANAADSDEEEHYEIMDDNQSFLFSENIENSLGYLP